MNKTISVLCLMLFFTINCQCLWASDLENLLSEKNVFENRNECGKSSDNIICIVHDTPPNLHIEEFNLHDSAYNKLSDDGSAFLKVGEKYEAHVWPESLVEHCLNGTTNEEVEVKTDTFVKIAMSEEDGSWQLLHRSYTHCKYMDEDDSKKEIFYYTVPPEAEGKRIFFKSKVDSANVIQESNENDNWSDVEVYPVEGYCPVCPDFVPLNVKLTCGKIDLNLGEKFGLEGDIVNQGKSPSPSDIRSAYYLKSPGATSWSYVTDDGSGSSNFCVGCSEHEYTTDSPFTANIIGAWEGMLCVDYLNQVSEMEEKNNCQSFTFNVNPAPIVMPPLTDEQLKAVIFVLFGSGE